MRIIVGAALIVFGIYRWLTRKRSAHTPGWMQSLAKLTPVRAALAAVALTVVNPKVLFICAAAGLAIGTAGLGSHSRVGCGGLVRGGRGLDGGDSDSRVCGFG